MSIATLITAEEFAGMSFDRPVELVRGEIIEMTNPGGRHGNLCFRLGGILYRWLESHPEFDAASNDTGVLLEQDLDTVRGPDILVMRKSRLPGGQFPKTHLTDSPELAIEVRSPSDRTSEILEKVAMYLAAGVVEVWVVDPGQRVVHVYHESEGDLTVSEQETLTSTCLPDFALPLANLFQGMAP